jgi:hypothetical protein
MNQYIYYHFFNADNNKIARRTFGGNAKQRRSSARKVLKSLGDGATVKVWKYLQGTAYTSGAYTN